MAALSRGLHINFISLVQQKVSAGLINKVATLNQLDSMGNMCGLPDWLATITRWPLSEISLYLNSSHCYL